jgi:drug/metabolite transporter (DMT)-like permease
MRYAVLIMSQLAVASAALWARWGLDLGVSPAALTSWRLTVASAILIPILRLRAAKDGRRPVPRRTGLTLIAAGAALGIHFWSWFVSLQHIPVARSTLLVSTTPLWAGLGLWAARRSAPARLFWAALGIAAIGVWLITGATESAQAVRPGGNAPYGDAMATLGAVCIALYFLLVAGHQAPLGTWRVVAWTYPSAACTVWVGIAISGAHTGIVPGSMQAWAAVVGMALLPQLIGHTALNWSLKHFTAGAVGAATLLEPVFAGWLAWLLLHETPTGIQLLGAAVLLAGVGLAIRSGRTAEPVAA